MITGAFLWTLFLAVLLVGGGVVLGSWLTGLAGGALARTGLDPMVRRLLLMGVRPLTVLVAVIAALALLDIDLTPVTVMLGAATLAIGFALQGSLSNVASGAMLLTLRPYREGEVIQAGGETGTVLEQGPFAVVLERPDGVLVTLPNNAAFHAPIHNFSRMGRRRVEVRALLDQGADLSKAAAALTKILAAHEACLEEPAPDVVVVGIEDRGVRVCARAWVASDAYAAAQSELTAAVLGALAKAKVALAPVPSRGDAA